MNAVEIEQAISDLAEQPFDAATFPYAFLEAFGNKETTLRRLRAGASNKSDLGGVLQTSNIHILTCDAGQVPKTLKALKESPATAKAKAKFILATDGADLEAEDLTNGETVACAFKDFPDHFGFFLPLAGITTVRQISENAFDIRATSRLNRLYVQLLKDNPDWGKAERRHDMNHFMARLIFCFFAEDTNIFGGKGRFTDTIAKMSAKDSSNTHEVIGELFRTMNTRPEDRASAEIPRWAATLPYVNGLLFSGSLDVPRFSKIARSYLLHVGGLDWTKINPDIFGSMIQAVAEDEERGELGMHYTSVPNILKVLNPLFLDDLRSQLEQAGDNSRTLLNLRKRMSKIRVFDPACGSGNFLVIAYKEMRAIETEINRRRGEPDIRSVIPLTNFRGIELRDFPAEIARLALVIAEYQCDVLYRGQKLALAEFLPLRNENWITCGNALRLDWLSICPPTGTGVKLVSDDLFQTPLDQPEFDFENEGGETYICGNPPYLGSRNQNQEQKNDLFHVLNKRLQGWKLLDYVSGWVVKASGYIEREPSARCAFVTTNSICQGQQAPILWPFLFRRRQQIRFAHTSFKWANNASKNAAVTCIIVGFGQGGGSSYIYEDDSKREVAAINRYLIAAADVDVPGRSTPISGHLPPMEYGNKPADNGHLLLTAPDARALLTAYPNSRNFFRPLCGTQELMSGKDRYCLWIRAEERKRAEAIAFIGERIEQVRQTRLASRDAGLNAMANRPHQFREMKEARRHSIVVPGLSSERRAYTPVGLREGSVVVSLTAFAIYDGPLWALSILSSKTSFAWNSVLAGKLKTDVRYSNSLSWNTLPVPALTDKNRADLERCAEDILLAREHHFPATIADLYDPSTMPADLKAAHDRNDEVLERIYIGRRFKNDTERLEKLFELYTKMAAAAEPAGAKKRKARFGA